MACGGGGGGGGNGTPDGAAGGEVADQGVPPDGASGGTAGGATPTDAAPGGEAVPDGATGGATGGQPSPDAGPDTPSCAATCALLDECGSSLPTDCVTTCSGLAPAERAAFGRCGERLDAGECAIEAFFECAAAGAFPACARACESNATCGLTLDAACGRACLGAALSEDPLESLRFAQRDACLEAAGADCDAAARCVSGALSATPDLAEWCDAYQACGFEAQFGFPCGDAFNILAGAPAPGGLACAWETLGAGACPPDPFGLLEQCTNRAAAPSLPACTATCEALVACQADAGETVDACVATCLGLADPDEGARVQAVAACAGAATCADLDACVLERGAAAQCEALCGRVGACVADADDAACDAECVATFGQVRTQRSLECAQTAQDCPMFTACLPPPTPPCDVYCASLDACGLVFGDPASCERDCAVQSANSGGFSDGRVACVVAARGVCEAPSPAVSVTACVQSSWAPAQGCLLACRAQTTCVGQPADTLWPCVQACVDGSADPELQTQALSIETCAAGIAGLAPVSCDDLAVCAPPVAGVDCEAYCVQVEACGVAPADCVRACGEDALARTRAASERTCLAEAGDDCDAVRGCRSYAPRGQRAPVDRAALCAQWSACGLDAFFTCDDALNLFGDSAATAQCFSDQLSLGCPGDPFALFDACFNRQRVDPICLANCVARGVCGLDGGGAACVSACVDGQPAAPDAVVRAAAANACLDQGTCGDYSACLAVSSPAAQCDAYCDDLEACGALSADVDAATCRRDCDRGFARLRSQSERACVTAAEGNCEAVRACMTTRPACEAACARVAGCGFEGVPFDCITACDDAAFIDPERGPLLATCVLTSPVCSPEAEACFAGATGPAELCARYCDVQVGCGKPNADPVACLNTCGAPLDADAALQLAAARACLLAAPAGDCAAQSACVPPEAATPNADTLCPTVTACGVPLDACTDALAGDTARMAAGCVVEAARLGLGCAAVAACVDFVPPPPAPGCDALCARRAACDPSVDAFLCAQACSSEPAAALVRAACAEVSRCGDLAACVALDAGVAPLCVAPCVDAVECGAFESAGACGAVCTGRLRSPSAPADYLVQLGACLGEQQAAPACDAALVRACFDFPSPGEGCAGACQVLVDCGALPGQTVEECAGECNNASMMNPDANARVIQCIVDFAGGGLCDLDGAQACANAAAGGGGGVDPDPVPPPPPAPR